MDPSSSASSTCTESSSTSNEASIEPLQCDEHVHRILKSSGFVEGTKITETLQGSIWRARRVSKRSGKVKSAVFKITNRMLHKNSQAIVDGTTYDTHENILYEQSILKFLTRQRNCPKSIVKWVGFWKTDTDYWLAMEDGGTSLFEFIQAAHELISDKLLDINEWKKIVKVIFKQMLECIDFLHSHNVSHNDISLENFLVSDIYIDFDKSSRVRFVGDIRIKLCDFGLATVFKKDNCFSEKHCGKNQYKSPEVLKRERFDVKKNDIWCIGMCLFAMNMGFFPWKKAHEAEGTFALGMNGYFRELLKEWKVVDVDEELVCLLESIFQYEEKRSSLIEIIQHSWISE